MEQCKAPIVKLSKEKSIYSGIDSEGKHKERHFRRKTHNQQNSSHSHLPHQAAIMRKVAD